MSQSEINVGLVGHVDHGKTSVTKMLSGKWTDTHSEEVKRGISIRLGYADSVIYKYIDEKGKVRYTTEKSIDGKKTEFVRRVSFIDAPGHETLMATMLSGAALMEAAILVIAANEECPQARTIEHLIALKSSGVKRLVVIQNKIDLVDKDKAIKNYDEITKFLSSYGYNDAKIIPMSANLGINKEELLKYLVDLEKKDDDENLDLNMFVVRSFDINVPGTKVENMIGGVLGGSITSGSIKIGDYIELSPGIEGKPITTKVLSLSADSGKIEMAGPGGLVAIGTNLDPSLMQNDKMKGQVIGNPNKLPKPVNKIKLEYELIGITDEISKPLTMGESLVLTIGTATNVGKITSIRDNVIEMTLSLPATYRINQRIAISRKSSSGWRLYGFGFSK